MSKKKVLIITYYWPPSGGAGVQRWVKFCKYLPQLDYEPVVLTVKDGTYPLIDETLVDQIPEELKVYRSKIIEPYSIFGALTGKGKLEVSKPATAFSTKNEGLIKRLGVWVRANFFIPDARRFWVPFAFKKAKEIIEEHQIETVITTAPPNSTHLIGTQLKKVFPELRWIMDMRDPWSKIFFNETIPRSNFADSLDVKYEKEALTLADEVIVVSESMAKLQKTVLNRHYHVIPNGFDHEDFPKIEAPTEHKKFTIKYVGSMTESAIPTAFFSALQALKESHITNFELQFFGSINDSVKAVVNSYGISNHVVFKGYIPHLQAKKEMQTADLLLLVIPDTANNELILTGKLFDYIAAEKPIFCIGPLPGDASDIILNYKLGYSFHYSHQQQMEKTLQFLLSGETPEYSKWEKEFSDHPFSRLSLTKQLAKVIE